MVILDMTRNELEAAYMKLKAIHNTTNIAVQRLQNLVKKLEKELDHEINKVEQMTLQIIIKDQVISQALNNANEINNDYL